jgi:hypothetical protein
MRRQFMVESSDFLGVIRAAGDLRANVARVTFPFTATNVVSPGNAPCLEYRMYLLDTGKVTVDAIIAPTQNFVLDAACASQSLSTIRSRRWWMRGRRTRSVIGKRR